MGSDELAGFLSFALVAQTGQHLAAGVIDANPWPQSGRCDIGANRRAQLADVDQTGVLVDVQAAGPGHVDRPLEEKMALFWHGLFATAYGKLNHAKAMVNQTDTFRSRGLGRFRTLLLELSRDPAMIFWLDNKDNHRGAPNENYGRELLEL